MLYILSSERSGSTLLAYMLAGAELIVVPPEMHIMAYGTVGQCIQHYPKSRSSIEMLCELVQVAMPPNIESFSPQEFYAWLCTAQHSYGWIVDKTPRYARDISTLEKTFTHDSAYIWLVRHPLGFLSSQLERIHKRLCDDPQSKQGRLLKEKILRKTGYRQRKLLRYWRRVNMNIETFLSDLHEDRFTKITYEELVQQPDKTLAHVANKIGVNLHAAMLTPSRNITKNLSWGIGDEKITQTSSIDPQRAFAWRDTLKLDTLPSDVLDVACRWGIDVSP